MMEISIADFHRSLYIPEIQNLAFHLPHVRILGTNHCGNTCRGLLLKCCRENQDMLCRRDHVERVVASFAHQIQSEYYGGNQSIYIEVTLLYHFSAPTQIETARTPQARTHHTVFLLFLSDNRKKYAATTISHRKRIITLLK